LIKPAGGGFLNIQMVDLKRQYQKYKTEIDKAVLKVLESAQYINGPDVSLLAEDIQNYLGVKNAVPCASGTDALQLALMALDIQPGDEVITTPFTFVATAETIALLGAKPVYVDITEKTYNINPDLILSAITQKTKAIIPVHLYGHPAEMDPIMKIARENRLAVIEDAAQALGAEYHQQPVCTFGDMGCISFFPSKNLGAFGDGGMVVTNNDTLAEKVRMIANHGCKIRYRHDVLGVNSRLDTLQAAVLRVKLKYLDEWNKSRQDRASYYNQGLQDPDIVLPYASPHVKHIYHQYTIQTRRRDELQNFLRQKGIPCAIHYPMPLHLQPAFINLTQQSEGNLPLAERATQKVISLPMHPDLTTEEQDYVIETIRNFLIN
jgi:dTDP-4-amino-4,6-dideoxygalactose transaminase